jgi:hypothetical protein
MAARRRTGTIAGVAAPAALAVLAALAIGGCGGGAAPVRHRAASAAGGACTSRALATLAAATAIPASAIANARFIATDGSAGCRFSAARAAGDPLAVTVEIDTAPQAYQHLDREVVEYSQGVIWFHEGEHAYPRSISGLGLEADWFPAEDKLMTTDGVRIVRVVVSSAPRRAGTGETLATKLARRYLGRLRSPF